MFSTDGTLISASAAPHCGVVIDDVVCRAEVVRSGEFITDDVICKIDEAVEDARRVYPELAIIRHSDVYLLLMTWFAGLNR